MVSKHKLIAVLVFVCLAEFLTSVVSMGEELPIWWSPSLELESLDRIDERLEKKFRPNDEKGLPIYKGKWPGDTEAIYDSCASLMRLTRDGYYVRTNLDLKPMLFKLATCHAIEMLAEARPSQTSFVRDFVMNADALNALPAMVDPSPSCDFLCRQYVANERRMSWSKFAVSKFLSVDAVGEDRMKVITETTSLTMETLARADFNGDGLEDLLLWVSAGATGGTWGTTTLFLLSRETPDSVFWVLNAHKRLCRDYQCSPYYDYPDALREVD